MAKLKLTYEFDDAAELLAHIANTSNLTFLPQLDAGVSEEKEETAEPLAEPPRSDDAKTMDDLKNLSRKLIKDRTTRDAVRKILEARGYAKVPDVKKEDIAEIYSELEAL